MAAKNKEVIEILDSDDDDEDDEVEIVEDKKPAASTFFRLPPKGGTCSICYCEYSSKEGILLSDCHHEFCQDCFGQYVQTKAKDGEVLANQMVCPYVLSGDKKCGRPLAQRDILLCLDSQQDRDRYLRLTLSRTVDQHDNMACCPTAGCSFQFEWDQDNRKLDCPLCHKTYCLVCQTSPWHAGIRCEDYQQQRKNESGKEDGGGGGGGDDEFQKFASKARLKQCPSCKFWVQKIGGCNAMHCRCNLVFCYQCGGCLKGTAQKNGFKECNCGSASLLQAHEGGPNHNLMPNPPPLPPMPQFAAAANPRAMGAAAAMMGMGMGMGFQPADYFAMPFAGAGQGHRLGGRADNDNNRNKRARRK